MHPAPAKNRSPDFGYDVNDWRTSVVTEYVELGFDRILLSGRLQFSTVCGVCDDLVA
jgi:hypothetical protein